MALDFTKKNVAAMAKALEPEYDGMVAELKAHKKALKAAEDDFEREGYERLVKIVTEQIEQVEEFALAALNTALDVIEDRAKFTVVGQVKTETIPSDCDEPTHRRIKGDKVALGLYATETKAREDAIRLGYSTQTHETAKVWVLPVHHGTPTEWYKRRKEEQKLADAADSSYRERELQRRIRWYEEHPGEPAPLDWTVEVAFESQTEECEACKGMGRVPKADLKRRADLDRVWN